VPAIFSFFLSNNFLYEGRLTFGSWDLSKYAKEGDAVFWANMGPNEMYWTVHLDNVRFSTDSKALEINSQYLILDTGSSYTMVPYFDFTNIIEFLQMSYGIDCDSDSDDDLANLYFCDCSNQQYDTLPDLEMTVLEGAGSSNSYVYSVPKEAYMKRNIIGKNELLLIPQSNASMYNSTTDEFYWVIGINLL